LFTDIQSNTAVQTFIVGNDLSFFVADTRVNRTQAEFMAPADLQKLRTWVQGLQCPGVIVFSQALFDVPGKPELNLCDFNQFVELCQILSDSRHDLLYISGDVHFGRTAQVLLKSGRTLYEVVTSPVSLVQDQYGDSSSYLAKARPSSQPANFPQVSVPNVPAQQIRYLDEVSAKPDDPARTAENFMTLKFQKGPQAGVLVQVTAWLPRRDWTEATVFRDFVRDFQLT
jgi:hypothetical protein